MLPRWRARLAREPERHDAASLMRSVNPAIIPRNHRIEQVIRAAMEGDLKPFERLLEALAEPYADRAEFDEYREAPLDEQKVRLTFLRNVSDCDPVKLEAGFGKPDALGAFSCEDILPRIYSYPTKDIPWRSTSKTPKSIGSQMSLSA